MKYVLLDIQIIERMKNDFQSSTTHLKSENSDGLIPVKPSRKKREICIEDISDSQPQNSHTPISSSHENQSRQSSQRKNEKPSQIRSNSHQALHKKFKIINLELQQSEQSMVEAANEPCFKETQTSFYKNRLNDNEDQKIEISSEQSNSQRSNKNNLMTEEEEQMAQKQERSIQNKGIFHKSNFFLPKYETFIIKRHQQWGSLNRLRPIFHMYTHNQHQYSAKMVSSNIKTTFTLTKSMEDFTENGDGYVGKIKTNFLGNQANMFGSGYSPAMAKKEGLPQRSMLATIQYETNFFQSPKTRSFKVYILKPDFEYRHLVGAEIIQEQKPLNKLYQSNKDAIIVLSNKKPQYNPTNQNYSLDFGGRIKLPSIRNFILEDEAPTKLSLSGNQELQLPILRMLFGKIGQDTFVMDIGEPIGCLLGLGIALSSFGNKMGCQ